MLIKTAWTIIKYFGWKCQNCEHWNETHEGRVVDLVVKCDSCNHLFRLED